MGQKKLVLFINPRENYLKGKKLRENSLHIKKRGYKHG